MVAYPGSGSADKATDVCLVHGNALGENPHGGGVGVRVVEEPVALLR